MLNFVEVAMLIASLVWVFRIINPKLVFEA
jgi:hypothetical protein